MRIADIHKTSIRAYLNHLNAIELNDPTLKNSLPSAVVIENFTAIQWCVFRENWPGHLDQDPLIKRIKLD